MKNKKSYPLFNYLYYLWSPHYFNKKTGTIHYEGEFRTFKGIDKDTIQPIYEHHYPPNFDEVYEKLPQYSKVYLRQLFIDACAMSGILTKENDHYGLLTAKRFSWDAPHDDEAKQYWSSAHGFCEEHELEGEYYNFQAFYQFMIAKQWCDVHGFPYLNKDNSISFLEFPDPYTGREIDEDD